LTQIGDQDPCGYKSHRWSQRHADGSRHCKDCGQIDAYGVDPDQVIGGYKTMTTDEKLDRVLKELADIRTILEGLMQPLVVLTDTGELHPDGTRKLVGVVRHVDDD
jgi:hypothetical protein